MAKRFYIAPQQVWRQHVHLFHGGQSHWIQLKDGLILISVEFPDGPHGRRNAAQWHSHPEVARLPHPERDGESTVPLSDLHTQSHFSQKRYSALHHQALIDSLGLQPEATVWDVHHAAKAIKPDVCLDEDDY